jgi:hypothetical protein
VAYFRWSFAWCSCTSLLPVDVRKINLLLQWRDYTAKWLEIVRVSLSRCALFSKYTTQVGMFTLRLKSEIWSTSLHHREKCAKWPVFRQHIKTGFRFSYSSYSNRKVYIFKIWSKNIEYFIGKLIDFGAENVHLGMRLGYPGSMLLLQKQFLVSRVNKLVWNFIFEKKTCKDIYQDWFNCFEMSWKLFLRAIFWGGVKTLHSRSADMKILIDMPIFASHGLKMLSIEA